MSEVLAIVSARAGSKGIQNKNFRSLAGGPSAAERASWCAVKAGLSNVIVTSDSPFALCNWERSPSEHIQLLIRPTALAQDDTPMMEVIKDVLTWVPGLPEQIIVLLQPTQPLRTPAHILSAIMLLQESRADSVVSVMQLPCTHSPDWAYAIRPNGQLERWLEWHGWLDQWLVHVPPMPTRRQETKPAYIRDGTVYVFWRKTLESGSLYGRTCRALVIPPEETCPLDTMADWAEAERRVRERERTHA